jgi:hypothetical protein
VRGRRPDPQQTRSAMKDDPAAAISFFREDGYEKDRCTHTLTYFVYLRKETAHLASGNFVYGCGAYPASAAFRARHAARAGKDRHMHPHMLCLLVCHPPATSRRPAEGEILRLSALFGFRLRVRG